MKEENTRIDDLLDINIAKEVEKRVIEKCPETSTMKP